jgi:hypothetical protein
MRDVAAAVGVSTALVSIVLRGAPGASAETRAKVAARSADGVVAWADDPVSRLAACA